MQSTSSRSNKDLIIWSSFIFLMLAWGSSFILMKRGLTAYTPAQVASTRIGTAAIALSFLAIQHFKFIPRHLYFYVFISAMCGIAIPAFMFTIAETHLSSSIAGVLNALTPCMTFIIGVVFFRHSGGHLKIIGLLLGFAGSATLILLNAKGELDLNTWALFVVFATLCYGINLNIVKNYLRDIKPLHLSTVTVALAGIFGLVYMLSTNWYMIYKTAPNGKSAMFAMVTLGLLGTATAQIVFNKMLQLSSAIFASSITYFIPLVAIIWGVLDGEGFNLWQVLGVLMIIGGIIILNKFK